MVDASDVTRRIEVTKEQALQAARNRRRQASQARQQTVQQAQAVRQRAAGVRQRASAVRQRLSPERRVLRSSDDNVRGMQARERNGRDPDAMRAEADAGDADLSAEEQALRQDAQQQAAFERGQVDAQRSDVSPSVSDFTDQGVETFVSPGPVVTREMQDEATAFGGAIEAERAQGLGDEIVPESVEGPLRDVANVGREASDAIRSNVRRAADLNRRFSTVGLAAGGEPTTGETAIGGLTAGGAAAPLEALALPDVAVQTTEATGSIATTAADEGTAASAEQAADVGETAVNIGIRSGEFAANNPFELAGEVAVGAAVGSARPSIRSVARRSRSSVNRFRADETAELGKQRSARATQTQIDPETVDDAEIQAERNRFMERVQQRSRTREQQTTQPADPESVEATTVRESDTADPDVDEALEERLPPRSEFEGDSAFESAKSDLLNRLAERENVPASDLRDAGQAGAEAVRPTAGTPDLDLRQSVPSGEAPGRIKPASERGLTVEQVRAFEADADVAGPEAVDEAIATGIKSGAAIGVDTTPAAAEATGLATDSAEAIAADVDTTVDQTLDQSVGTTVDVTTDRVADLDASREMTGEMTDTRTDTRTRTRPGDIDRVRTEVRTDTETRTPDAEFERPRFDLDTDVRTETETRRETETDRRRRDIDINDDDDDRDRFGPPLGDDPIVSQLNLGPVQDVREREQALTSGLDDITEGL